VKLGWFLVLMMSSTACFDGIGHARGFERRSEALSSQAGEDVRADHAGEGAKNAGGKAYEAGGGHLDQQHNGPAMATRGASKSRASRGHLPPTAGSPPHAGQTPSRRSFRGDKPGTAINSDVTRSPSVGVPGGAGDRDRGSVHPPVAAALNGQQFKNAHNPGASLAIRRELSSASGGTGVINGTDMKSKP